jgi:hypothetical protein
LFSARGEFELWELGAGRTDAELFLIMKAIGEIYA